MSRPVNRDLVILISQIAVTGFLAIGVNHFIQDNKDCKPDFILGFYMKLPIDLVPHVWVEERYKQVIKEMHQRGLNLDDIINNKN